MSDESRCGSFCMRHWENRRSCVCSSVMEVVSDDILFYVRNAGGEEGSGEGGRADWLAKESEAGGEFDWEGWGGFVGGVWAGVEFGNCCRD